MASSIANIAKIPELRRRILLTLVLLAVYRVGVFVSVPGVNRQVMKDMVKAASGSFLGLFNMFSGGALEQMSIFALGIMPYISASIILQLLTVVIPALDRLSLQGSLRSTAIRAHNSAVECILHTDEVVGSIPTRAAVN